MPFHFSYYAGVHLKNQSLNLITRPHILFFVYFVDLMLQLTLFVITVKSCQVGSEFSFDEGWEKLSMKASVREERATYSLSLQLVKMQKWPHYWKFYELKIEILQLFKFAKLLLEERQNLSIPSS